MAYSFLGKKLAFTSVRSTSSKSGTGTGTDAPGATSSHSSENDNDNTNDSKVVSSFASFNLPETTSFEGSGSPRVDPDDDAATGTEGLVDKSDDADDGYV